MAANVAADVQLVWPVSPGLFVTLPREAATIPEALAPPEVPIGGYDGLVVEEEEAAAAAATIVAALGEVNCWCMLADVPLPTSGCRCA